MVRSSGRGPKPVSGISTHLVPREPGMGAIRVGRGEVRKAACLDHVKGNKGGKKVLQTCAGCSVLKIPEGGVAKKNVGLTGTIRHL